jgi:hypothetical protein
MYTNDQINTIKIRAYRHLLNSISKSNEFDPSSIMIEQLLNIIQQYEDNMPLWMKLESNNA